MCKRPRTSHNPSQAVSLNLEPLFRHRRHICIYGLDQSCFSDLQSAAVMKRLLHLVERSAILSVRGIACPLHAEATSRLFWKRFRCCSLFVSSTMQRQYMRLTSRSLINQSGLSCYAGLLEPRLLGANTLSESNSSLANKILTAPSFSYSVIASANELATSNGAAL